MKRIKMDVGDVIRLRRGDEIIELQYEYENGQHTTGRKAKIGVHAASDWKIELFTNNGRRVEGLHRERKEALEREQELHDAKKTSRGR